MSIPMAAPKWTPICTTQTSNKGQMTAAIRDRDSIYGADFVARIGGLGIEDTSTAPRFRWQIHSSNG